MIHVSYSFSRNNSEKFQNFLENKKYLSDINTFCPTLTQLQNVCSVQHFDYLFKKMRYKLQKICALNFSKNEGISKFGHFLKKKKQINCLQLEI